MKLPNMGLARLPFIRATAAQYQAFTEQIMVWCKTASIGASWCPHVSHVEQLASKILKSE
jgi:hypothetical protein